MRLRLTALIVTLAVGLLAAPLPADAQQAGKVYRMGYLSRKTRSADAVFVDALLQGLRDLGWVEGQNLIIEWRYAEGRIEQLPDLAAELVRLKLDVIVPSTTPTTHAAKNATTTIPIVFVFVNNPVEQGFVDSLARPGGNVTGVSFVPGLEIFAKRLQLLKETLPNASRVAVLYNPNNPYTPGALRETEVAARALGLQLQILRVRGPDEFDSAFAAMTRERADAILVVSDAMLSTNRRRLAELTAKHRLPAMHGVRAHVEAGDLMAYGETFPSHARRAARHIDKILKGTKPADLPVERPRDFQLTINLKTAKALGLTIPPSLLLQADEVIR